MESLQDSGERLEMGLKPEPLTAPAFGSVALHGCLAGVILAWGLVGGLFHHSEWGSAGGGGAIQVSLVSSAIPLPADKPPSENVLATETPSNAPAEPTSKTKQAVDETAIAIQGKQKSKPQPVTQQRSTAKQQPTNNRAQYGEQSGSNVARSMQTNSGSGPASVSNGDFGSRFPWFVDAINRKVRSNWYSQEVDPRTPRGLRTYLVFAIRRDGTPQNPQVDRSSGSATLDRSCLRAVQRVDTFGNLPTGYNGSTISVSYYCEY